MSDRFSSGPPAPSPPPELPGDDPRRLFVAHVNALLFADYLGRRIYNDYLYSSLTSWVAQELGARWVEGKNLAYYVQDDYDRCRRAVEAAYEVLARLHNVEYAVEFQELILELVREYGPALHLGWARGRFHTLPAPPPNA